MNTSEVLNRAADLIEERGWATGNCGMDASPGAALCLEGALGAAMGVAVVDGLSAYPIYDYTEIEVAPVYQILQDYLAWMSDLYMWNDRRDRTQAEVVEALRACAVIEAAREHEAVEVSA